MSKYFALPNTIFGKWRLWLKGQIVHDVPPEDALCEFDCRKTLRHSAGLMNGPIVRTASLISLGRQTARRQRKPNERFLWAIFTVSEVRRRLRSGDHSQRRRPKLETSCGLFNLDRQLGFRLAD